MQHTQDKGCCNKPTQQLQKISSKIFVKKQAWENQAESKPKKNFQVFGELCV